MWKISIKGLGPDVLCEKVRSPNGCCWLPPKFVGEADLGGRLALFGSDGYGVLAHSVHGMACAREVRAVWRALFLPDSEGADDGSPNSEHLQSSSSMLTSAPPVRSSRLHVLAEEGRDGAGFQVAELDEECGNEAAQRVHGEEMSCARSWG